MTAAQKNQQESGLPLAIVAYVCWGFIPLYFAQLKGVAPLEILAHRVVWSLPFAFLILHFRGQWGEFLTAVRSPVALRTMALSSLLIATNWLIYVWAIIEGHVLATSIGYYLNPLVNVLLGRVFLGERLTRLQGVAVAVAILGVSVLLLNALDTLWISLSLAFSFSGYGLVRKMAPTGAVPGLSVELCVMAPFALALVGWTLFSGKGPETAQTGALLMAGGVITVIPLLLFATAARRMSYTALGFVQFLAPTIVFLLGLFYFHEPLNTMRLACFMLIWAAVAIFSFDAVRRRRA